MAAKPKFTRIPKTTALLKAGVPAEAVATYCCLADHANNRTGECWPSMKRLAEILGRSVRTVQRHLHTLKECGMVEFVERRRHKGRFSSYLYRVLHIVQTTGHGRPVGKRGLNKREHKRTTNTPQPPSKNPKEGYHHLFGEDSPPNVQEAHDEQAKRKRKEEEERRKKGYEWLFKQS